MGKENMSLKWLQIIQALPGHPAIAREHFGVFSVTLDANRDEPSMYPNNSWSLWGLYGGDRIEITSEEYAPVSLNPP
jgi:hypothetical protein